MSDAPTPPPATALSVLARVSPRACVRAGFFAFFAYACWQLWRYYEWALGIGTFVQRPEATAGFVPLGALMSLGAWLKTGQFDPVMPAAVVVILAALAVSLLFKRGFCGWICPVGTTASVFGWLGRRLNRGRYRRMPRGLDLTLRVPKYLAGAYLVGSMAMLPASIALEFQKLPYYATSDVKILYGLLHPAWGYWVLAGFVALTSLAIGTNTWCRYLCPLGAVYGAASAASPCIVKRDAERCIGCAKCDHACAARIEVSKSTAAVRGPECDGCQDCVRACPAPGALTARLGRATIPWWIWPVLLVTVWLFLWALAVASGHWHHGLPDTVIAEYLRAMKVTHDF